MTRASLSFAEMIRSMLMVSAMFVLFVLSHQVMSNGFSTPAFASSETAKLGAVQKKSNGVGFVLMVSLQRAG